MLLEKTLGVVDGQIIAKPFLVLRARDNEVINRDAIIEIKPGIIVYYVFRGVRGFLLFDVAERPTVTHN